MRLPLILSFFVALACAYDSVIFSSTNNKNIDSLAPSTDALLAAATVDSPVFFLVQPDFTLALFSRHAAAYKESSTATSPIALAARAANSVGSRHIKDAIPLADKTPTITAEKPYQPGSAVYVVRASSWESLDELSKGLLELPATAFVVTSIDALDMTAARERRDAANAISVPMPLIMPPVNLTDAPVGDVKKQPCMLFLEGLNFVLETRKTATAKPTYITVTLRIDNETATPTNPSTFDWDPTYVTCPYANLSSLDGGIKSALSTFIIRIKPKANPTTKADAKEKLTVAGPFNLKLVIEHHYLGYWQLKTFELLDDIRITADSAIVAKKGISTSSAMIGMGSVFAYGWNCQNSEVAFFATDKETNRLGIGFHNTQIQLYTHDNTEKMTLDGMSKFNLKIDNCTGTFSAASWMGIISALVMISILLFGMLMLNSVQTLDRLDDPKQRQILINVRE